MLSEFITTHREEIIARCRLRVATRPHATFTEADIDYGVPLFLEQAVHSLRSMGPPNAEIGTTAALHGHALLRQGFTASQVVHDYGDVCQTITELALEMNAPIETGEFRTLNRCLDEAIAEAVTVYGRESEQTSLDREMDRGIQRMGFLTHELRNLVNAALLAFGVLKTGQVGLQGSTGAVLERSLTSLRDLITRSLDEVRLTAGVQKRERTAVVELIEALTDAATLEAHSRGRTLVVAPVEDGLTVEVDRSILTAVVMNLLQNAMKFSPAGSRVMLEVGASADRVLIGIRDECGGLPEGGDLRGLFRPFEQRGADRTGMGLGLAFCRWGAEANNGRLYARNLPGEGCVFTVDLPRSLKPTVAASLV